LGHISLTRKIVSEMTYNCVEWDVKPYYTILYHTYLRNGTRQRPHSYNGTLRGTYALLNGVISSDLERLSNIFKFNHRERRRPLCDSGAFIVQFTRECCCFHYLFIHCYCNKSGSSLSIALYTH